MQQNTAIYLGFFAASVAPVLILAAALPFAGNWGALQILGLLLLYYVVSALATLIFGVPVFRLLRHLQLIRWWSALSAGFVIGALMAALVRMPHQVRARDVFVMGSAGVASALSFWTIWRQGRGPMARKTEGNQRRV